MNINKLILTSLVILPFIQARVLSLNERTVVIKMRDMQTITHSQARTFVSLLQENFEKKRVDLSNCKGEIIQQLSDKLLGNC